MYIYTILYMMIFDIDVNIEINKISMPFECGISILSETHVGIGKHREYQ